MYNDIKRAPDRIEDIKDHRDAAFIADEIMRMSVGYAGVDSLSEHLLIRTLLNFLLDWAPLEDLNMRTMRLLSEHLRDSIDVRWTSTALVFRQLGTGYRPNCEHVLERSKYVRRYDGARAGSFGLPVEDETLCTWAELLSRAGFYGVYDVASSVSFRLRSLNL